MNLPAETYERILARLEQEHGSGRLKKRSDSILLFAEVTKARMSREESYAVRGFLSRVLRHSRAIKRVLRQGNEQIEEIEGALSMKPAQTPSDLGNQIGEAWLVHQETAFLQAVKERLEAEGMRLRAESEILREPISKYHDLMDAWDDFSKWAASICLPCRTELKENPIS